MPESDPSACEYVTIVSGLPRSGTSLMMQMLAAGGMPVWTDEVRAADADNPRGYFEYERVKRLNVDNSWLMEARGHAVKIVAPLLQYVPPGDFRVIFMRRDIAEVLRSQAQMLERSGKSGSRLSAEQLASAFQKQLLRAEAHLREAGLETLFVDYRACHNDSTAVAHVVNAFLAGVLAEQKMVQAVDQTLYRQRSS